MNATTNCSHGVVCSTKADTHFESLPPDEQEAVRQAQRRRKMEKKQARQAKQGACVETAALEMAVEPSSSSESKDLLAAVSSFPDEISMATYFSACPGSLFRDPSLPPTQDSLALLMAALQADDEQAKSLNTCNYFQFAGKDDAIWDAEFNARLAWEGFFTITTRRRGGHEPLPELQPFYGVLTWPNFSAAKHVRAHISKMRRRLQEEGSRSCQKADATGPRKRHLRLVDNEDRLECWMQMDKYHKEKHGSNWLTERYLRMMEAASDDPKINFQMHVICLVEDIWDEAQEGPRKGGGDTALKEDEGGRAAERSPSASTVLAGEIGFSIGQVYTSLSGWTAARTSEAHGTSQLVLLGLWLQRKGQALLPTTHHQLPRPLPLAPLGFPGRGCRPGSLIFRHSSTGFPGLQAC